MLLETAKCEESNYVLIKSPHGLQVNIPETCTVTVDEICSICSLSIPNFIPDYFYGEKMNSACTKCKGPEADDPFSSFPLDGLPQSLISHWIPPHVPPLQSLGNIVSLRCHYVILPYSADTFASPEEFFKELKLLWDEDRRLMRSDCKQS